MADIADIANDRAEQLLARALSKQVGKSAPESHPDFNGRDCVDCVEPIPAERRQLGKVRCVGCQGVLERRRALGLA
jgi:RNA polymerase-binding transcription factor DksA